MRALHLLAPLLLGPSILCKNINDNINTNKVPDFTVNEEACDKTIKTQSSYKYWKDDANKKRKAHKNFDTPRNTNKAKNIILFIGDGMNIDSVTGGRIEAGREKSFMDGVGCGEEYEQFIESFPFTGLSKTYSVDAQTPDSASTATAIFTGVKAPYLTVGLQGAHSADVKSSFLWDSTDKQDCINKLSIVEQLKDDRGATDFKVGLVTNTMFNHATPASAYGCTNYRLAYGTITEQFTEAINNGRIDVSFSGGRKYDGDIEAKRGSKIEKVFDKNKMDKIPNDFLSEGKQNRVVGLFTDSYMNYIDERKHNEPSLIDMSVKALKLLKTSAKNGFFLMVEGGLIDKAHHQNWALRSMREVKELDAAVKAVFEELSEKEREETLIVVTADHGHTFTFGHPGTKRGSSIVEQTKNTCNLDTFSSKSGGKQSYDDEALQQCKNNKHRIAGYYSGPNDRVFRAETENSIASETNHDNSKKQVFTEKMMSASVVSQASHSAEDVPIYARGPMAHMFSGVNEQPYIGQAMKYASCVGQFGKWKTIKGKKQYVQHC